MDRQTDTPDMRDRNEINKMNALDVLDVDTVYYPEAKEYGAFCNIESGSYSVCAVQVQLLRFRSKD